ncbi:MAG: VCBS repeat-containing protein, partial [Verrucomicrobiaceae bacterium]
FCYNNQRLVLEASGTTYGANDAKYRTEVESLARVISKDAAGNGPASFSVEEKTGHKFKFGATADSRLIPAPSASGDTQSTTVLTWYLSEMTDPVGNTISYTYKAGAAGEVLLDTVSYAGGKAKLVFNYRSDPNPRTLFVAGGKIQYTQLLDRVSTYVNQTIEGHAVDVLVKDYRLGYEFADAKGATEAVKPIGRLTSVTECSTAQAAATQNCLTPTRFEWDAWREADNTFGVPKRVGSPSDNKLNFSYDNEYSTEGDYFIRRVFDLNRDGRLDFISTWRDGIHSYLSKSDGTYPNNPTKISDDYGENQNWFDYRLGRGSLFISNNNADGSSVLLGFANGLLNVPKGSFSSKWNQSSSTFSSPKRKLLDQSAISGDIFRRCEGDQVWDDLYLPRFVIDLDGDGYPEVVRLTPGGVIAAKWRADTATMDIPQSVGSLLAQDCSQSNSAYRIIWDVRMRPTFLQDMNNDGAPDLVTVQRDAVFVSLYDPSSGTFGSLSQYSVGIVGSGYLFGTGGRPADETFLTDMNGDGYPDIVQMKWDGIYVSLWTGTKFLPSTKWSSQLSGAGWNPSDTSKGDTMAHFVVDVDGDGFPDVVGISGDQGVQVMLSDGATGFAAPQPWSSDFKWNGPDRSGNYYYQYNKTPRFMADVDGDGTPDIVGFGTKFMSWAPGSRVPGARIKRVADGLGASVDVRYGVAQPYNKEVYQAPATPSIVPLRDAPGP